MSLTGAPPPLPASVTAAASAADVPDVVGQILAVRQPGAPGVSSQEVLNAATGPGNVLSGQVTELTLNGTATLVTATGAEITMHNLPTQLMQLGSSVTLRIASQQPVLQATLLQIDGKPVAGLLARAAAGGNANAPAASIPVATPPAPVLNMAAPSLSAAAASPLIDSALAVVASLVASVEGDAGQAAALMGPVSNPQTAINPALLSGLAQVARDGSSPLPAPQPGIDGSLLHAPLSTGNGLAAGTIVVATLIRAALPKPGGVAPPLGTRYALAITAVAPPSAGDAGDTPIQTPSAQTPPPPSEEPAPPVTFQSTAQASPPTAANTADFIPQVTILAGRVTASSTNGGVEIDTALGTLSLPAPDAPIPIGSAVQLRVSAVAPPLPGVRSTLAEATATPAPTEHATGAFAAALEAMDEADAWGGTSGHATSLLPDAATGTDPTLAAVEAAAAAMPSLPTQLGQLFAMPPSALAAVIYGFLAGSMPSPAKRWPESAARDALVKAGRDDLVSALDGDAKTIGQTQLTPPPSPWLVTTLPYLGQVSVGPIKVYRKPVGEEEKRAIRAGKSGEHFVIEVDLAKLGPMQFEGLVRDRRFDLALRTRQPLHTDLQNAIRRAYTDILAAGGYGGELTFARSIAFPLVSPLQTAAHREVSA